MPNNSLAPRPSVQMTSEFFFQPTNWGPNDPKFYQTIDGNLLFIYCIKYALPFPPELQEKARLALEKIDHEQLWAIDEEYARLCTFTVNADLYGKNGQLIRSYQPYAIDDALEVEVHAAMGGDQVLLIKKPFSVSHRFLNEFVTQAIDLNTQKILWSLPLMEETVNSVQLSADGMILLTQDIIFNTTESKVFTLYRLDNKGQIVWQQAENIPERLKDLMKSRSDNPELTYTYGHITLGPKTDKGIIVYGQVYLSDQPKTEDNQDLHFLLAFDPEGKYQHGCIQSLNENENNEGIWDCRHTHDDFMQDVRIPILYAQRNFEQKNYRIYLYHFNVDCRRHDSFRHSSFILPKTKSKKEYVQNILTTLADSNSGQYFLYYQYPYEFGKIPQNSEDRIWQEKSWEIFPHIRPALILVKVDQHGKILANREIIAADHPDSFLNIGYSIEDDRYIPLPAAYYHMILVDNEKSLLISVYHPNFHRSESRVSPGQMVLRHYKVSLTP